MQVLKTKSDIIFTAETHNMPTAVCPFSGATTGTGGRIRDVQAVGRGGHCVAGTAGYCVGNLKLPGKQSNIIFANHSWAFYKYIYFFIIQALICPGKMTFGIIHLILLHLSMF